MRVRSILPIVLLVSAALPALRSLAADGFYTSHDGLTHTARIANYYLAIKEGQLPPRLATNLFGGLGYPMFLFIYPLPYLLGAALYAGGFAFTTSFEIIIGASFVLSAVSMFIFLRDFFDVTPAFVGALFYSWAPYRFSQLYVRAAIAESFAYIFVPLILLAIFKLSRTGKTRWVGIGSLSLSGLLLSHQLVSLMFLPVFVIFGYMFLKQTKRPRVYLLGAVAMTLVGISTAAFIYLPVLMERKFLRFDELIDYYADHFVTLPQLVHSPWSYGFSMPGTMNDDMSFQVGLTHLLVAGLSLIWLGWIIVRKKREAGKTPFFWFGIVSLGLFAASLGLMLEHPLVRFFWKYLPGLSLIDFPWRLLGVAVFAASLTAAYLVNAYRNKLLLSLLVFFVFYANRNHLRINQTQNFDDRFFLSYDQTATWRNEFLPTWRITNKLGHLEGEYSLRSGVIDVETLEARTHLLKFKVTSPTGGSLQIHRLYFPGWTVLLDGEQLELNGDLSLTSNIQLETETEPYVDRSGLMEVRIPRGEHLLEAKFSETPVRKTGFVLTGIGIVSSTWLAATTGSIPSLRRNKPSRRKKR